MVRILDDIENDLAELEEWFDNLKMTLKEKQDDRENLLEERDKYIVDNDLYRPMSELLNHKGEQIWSIKLVQKHLDDSLSVKYLEGQTFDDTIFINNNGRIILFSHRDYSFDYDFRSERYLEWDGFHSRTYNIVGFFDLRFVEE